MPLLKQATAYTRMFYLVDTGLTPTVTISKAGAAFGAADNSPAEVSDGWYKLDLTTTDTNTAGELCYHFSTGTNKDFQDQVGANVVANALAAGVIGSSTFAADAANYIADSLLDRTNGIETSYTLKQSLRLILAALAGKLSGAGTTTVTVRDVGDSKDRLVATVDSSGNRTAVTKDVS